MKTFNNDRIEIATRIEDTENKKPNTMVKQVGNAKTPDWMKKVVRNEKARKRYFMNRYGSLDRMHALDEKLQEWWDEESFKEAMNETEE